MRFAKFILPLIFTAACLAEEPVKLPEGVDALPTDLRGKMADLLKNAEKYRGLKCIHAVPSGSLNEAALRSKMKMMFEEELPAAKMNPLESALKIFGFIPNDMKLSTYLPELMTSQVGGYYDPRRNYLIVVQREGGLLGAEAKKTLGPLADRMEETVLVHELTHALQDQHFDLKKFMIEDPLSDAGAARTAVVEGDATLTMYNFFAQMEIEKMPMMQEMMSELLKDPKQLMSMSPDMPGAKEMESAPAYFRDTLLFSYLQGYVFCISVKKLGGQKLLDYAFTKDPPRSTEQILHPEKWHTKRDDPVEITLPDFAAAAPGWKKIAEGTLGELGIKILLNDCLKNNEAACTAAGGWGGDRFAVLEKNGEFVLAWVTDWDTPSDAAKFKKAAAKLGENWNTVSPNPKRVTLTRTSSKAGLAVVLDLMKSIAAAKASTPDNKNIDLAALGIKAGVAQAGDKNQETLDINKLTKNGEIDLDKMLDDPNFEKMMKQVGEKMGVGDMDLSTMMKNPIMKDMMKNMMKNMTADTAPEGKFSADGRQYTNEGLGINMSLPAEAKNWTLVKQSAPLLFVVNSPDSTAQVQIAVPPVPIAPPIEMMSMSVEMGLKMVLKDLKKLKDGFIGEGAQKGYEIQYTGSIEGESIRATQRMFVQAGRMIAITARTPETDWKQHEKAINAILESIKLTGAKPAAPEKVKVSEAPLGVGLQNEPEIIDKNRANPHQGERATEIKSERKEGGATIDRILKDLNIEKQEAK